MAILDRVTKDGKKHYQVLVDRIGEDGKRSRKVVGTYSTKKEAKAEEARAKTDMKRGTFVDPSAKTVRQTIETWLEVKSGTGISANSLYEYRIAAEKHIYPVLGARPVQKVTHSQLQAQVSVWTKSGMSASLVRRCISVLKQSMATARQDNIIIANPADGLNQPAKVQKKDLLAWTPSEMSRFLEASETDHYAPLWHVLLLEGCRRGEALGLRWQDLDLERGRATIIQTVVPDVTNKGAALVQPRTKTRAGTRTIALTSTTVEKLRQHQDKARFAYKASGREWKTSDLVFQTSKGTPINPTSIKRNLGLILKAAGVPAITTHDLRHIAATRMLAAGVPVAIVSQKLGHSSVAITTDIYSHFIPDDQDVAVQAMDALLAQGKVASNA